MLFKIGVGVTVFLPIALLIVAAIFFPSKVDPVDFRFVFNMADGSQFTFIKTVSVYQSPQCGRDPWHRMKPCRKQSGCMRGRFPGQNQ
jgi:predicted RNA-binding Zn-ribbon protein involved in translation (DUF1610 family)